MSEIISKLITEKYYWFRLILDIEITIKDMAKIGFLAKKLLNIG